MEMEKENLIRHGVDFEELGESHFIWVPLKSIPVVDNLPVNSLEQPALKIFNLVENGAKTKKFGIKNQRYLAELAKQHKGMGYFLYHNEGDFGIIGVRESSPFGEKVGRAMIFNATEAIDRKKVRATMLDIIGVKTVKKAYRDCYYRKGDIAFWHTVYSADIADFDPEYDVC